MSRKTLQIAVLTTLIMFPFSRVSLGAYSGGDGTPEAPYQVSGPLDWANLASTPADWDKHFVLTAGIDFGWGSLTPIGNNATPFTGEFNGNGYIVRNGVVNFFADYGVGLFGRLGEGGTLRNLGVEQITVVGAWFVGGLVGENNGFIEHCYCKSSVNGNWRVGGLVGFSIMGSIDACYASGAVSGNIEVGGLVGNNLAGSGIRACYATGAVTGNSSIGGLVGENSGEILASFWDVESSGRTGSSGGKGLTTARMGSIDSFQNAGWNGTIWSMTSGQYPRLDWEGFGWPEIPIPEPVPLSGNGTSDDPYLVESAEDFALLSNYASLLDKTFRLTTDLDLSGTVLSPIGDLGAFSGVFEGDGHLLSHPEILLPESDFVGIFSVIHEQGRIQNLQAESLNIAGDGHVGGAAGLNRGALVNCQIQGSVTGTTFAGGVTGCNTEGTITSCSADVTVTGETAGGLVGKNEGLVKSSHSSGTVSGGALIGGLIGNHVSGIVTYCNASASSSGTQSVGGLIGKNSGVLEASYASGDITGGSSAGGLIGENSFGAISLCSATGSVTATGDLAGGLVGKNFYGTIDASYASGEVQGNDGVGGLAGQNDGQIDSCYAAGAVAGRNNAGGLVGANGSGGSLRLCFAAGNATGVDFVGGLAGKNEGNIRNCYARGAASGNARIGGLLGSHSGFLHACYSTGVVTGISLAGGLVGNLAAGSISACYWDTDTSGLETSAGGEGRSTGEMTFPYGGGAYSGWEFPAVWVSDETSLKNDGYPYLRVNTPPPREGESEFHPADNDEDLRITMGEAIPYLSGWQRGANPMAYAIRAAYLWQNGEEYAYDAGQSPPLCWVLNIGK